VYILTVCGGTLKHYRDRYNLECDNILVFEDGRYALVEIKLGGTMIKEGNGSVTSPYKIVEDKITK